MHLNLSDIFEIQLDGMKIYRIIVPLLSLVCFLPVILFFKVYENVIGKTWIIVMTITGIIRSKFD